MSSIVTAIFGWIQTIGEILSKAGGAANNALGKVNNVLYAPWVIPLILLCGGIYLSVRLKFLQVRMIKEGFRVLMDKPKEANGISSFGALMISTASRVGTGNIIGVASAICIGGAGSVFWMWVTAVLGGASAFAESTLAQIFKKRNPDGSSYGGPAFYMQDKLKCRPLGVIFSILIIITYAIGFNMLASYNIQSAFSSFKFYEFKYTPAIIGVVLAGLFALCVIGGSKKLSKITSYLVPTMGVLYIAVAILVLLINAQNIPAMFKNIFVSAFNFKAMLGGFAGSCLVMGVKRGLFSNEAGMGSAPNAAATADVTHPAKQGLVQMLSVFLDTLVICTCTAFMLLSVGFSPEGLKDAQYVQFAINFSLGNFGTFFVAAALTLFGFTTLIGNYAYCEGCLNFIFKKPISKNGMTLFAIAASVFVFIGAVAQASAVWSFAELTQALMVLVNMPVVLGLSNYAVRCLNDYCKQRKKGKNPVFRAKDIGIDEKLDFWQ